MRDTLFSFLIGAAILCAFWVVLCTWADDDTKVQLWWADHYPEPELDPEHDRHNAFTEGER